MALTDKAMERRGYGTRLLVNGLYLPAREQFLQWYELVKESPPSEVIPALNALTAVAHRQGAIDEALRWVEAARTAADQERTAGVDRLMVYLNLLMVYTDVGRLDEALACAQIAESMQRSEEQRYSQAYWLNLSMLYWRRGDWVQMRRASRLAYDHCTRSGDRLASAKAMTNLGIAHLELGEADLAERDLQRALAMFAAENSPVRAYVEAELGRLYFQRGEHERALEEGRKALDALLTGIGVIDKEEVARVSRLFGAIFSVFGRRNLTLKYLNRAAAYFSQLGLRSEWQRSTEMIGQVLSAAPRPGRRELLEEAHRLDFLTAVLDLTDDLESVDPTLRGHSERVAHLAVILGEALGLPETQLRLLGYAARMHDVGKVAIEAELFDREDALSESEQQRLAMHPVIGEEMLRPHGLESMGLKAIRHHHERMDGSGYPDGLAGDEIPLLARIIAVVNRYDRLTSERASRPGLTHAEALDRLAEAAGRELDPDLVVQFRVLHDLT